MNTKTGGEWRATDGATNTGHAYVMCDGVVMADCGRGGTKLADEIAAAVNSARRNGSVALQDAAVKFLLSLRWELFADWAVNEDVEINGGDAVEWLGALLNDLHAIVESNGAGELAAAFERTQEHPEYTIEAWRASGSTDSYTAWMEAQAEEAGR